MLETLQSVSICVVTTLKGRERERVRVRKKVRREREKREGEERGGERES